MNRPNRSWFEEMRWSMREDHWVFSWNGLAELFKSAVGIVIVEPGVQVAVVGPLAGQMKVTSGRAGVGVEFVAGKNCNKA
jgi:hypothetical protein